MRYDPTNQWVLETVSLPAGAANQATLYVAFYFTSQYGNDCHMDIMHVKGLLPCATPVAQATSLNLTPTMSSIAGSFTASASADSYLVVRSLSSSLSATPVDGIVYPAGTALGGGVVDYFGTATSFNSTGLTASTLYYYYIFAANNATCAGGPLYLSTSPLTGNTTTLAPVPICGIKTVGASGADLCESYGCNYCPGWRYTLWSAYIALEFRL